MITFMKPIYKMNKEELAEESLKLIDKIKDDFSKGCTSETYKYLEVYEKIMNILTKDTNQNWLEMFYPNLTKNVKILSREDVINLKSLCPRKY